MQAIPFTVRIFKEGETFVAHAPELDVSSYGNTETEARRNIQHAVKGFLETAGKLGLHGVLEEAGYRREKGEWHAPQFVALDHLSVGVG